MKDYLFLDTLDLAGNRIEGVVGGKAIAMLVARQAQRQGGSPLTKIDLANNLLGNDGLALVLQALSQPQTGLAHLDLTANNIDLILGEPYETPGCTRHVDLDHLILDGNEFRKGGYYRLANLLGQTSHLVTLSLKDCLLNDAGFAMVLAELLGRQRRLEKVDFSGNTITDVGMVDLAREVRESRRLLLRSLKLNGNQIQTEGAVRLFGALSAGNAISEVCLAENAIKEDFADLLVAWMKRIRAQDTSHSHNLTRIDLQGNALAVKGFRDIGQQVSINVRFQNEKKAREIAAEIAMKKIGRGAYANTVRKQKRCAEDLSLMDGDLQRWHALSEEKKERYAKELERDRRTLERIR